MKTLSKYDKYIILSLFLLSFLFKGLFACIFFLLLLVSLLLYEKKLVKPFNNTGFLIFLSITLFIPVIIHPEPQKIVENAVIIARGITFLFTLYFLFKDIESSKIYPYLEKILPDDLKTSVKTALKLFPKINSVFTESWNNIKQDKKLSIKALVQLFEAIIQQAEELNAPVIDLPGVYIITGKVHEGKSSLAYKTANKLINKRLKVGGIISKSINEGNNRTGYEVIDLKSGKTAQLATVNKLDNYSEVCGRFYFYKEGMDFALNSLRSDYLQNTDIVFIDEMGKLELGEKGFYKSIIELLSSEIPTIIMVVRDEYIDEVKEKFNFEPVNIIRVS